MDNGIFKKLLSAQKDEMTGHIIYTYLAGMEKDPANRAILVEMAGDELKHYQVLKKYTGLSPEADRFSICCYRLLSYFSGIMFTIKLMERTENKSLSVYEELAHSYPEFIAIREQEEVHEEKLVAMIQESRLNYLGAVILGLNDALIELTGALAGFTLALQDSLTIAITGSITGIAAALSMASSEYLAIKAESSTRDAAKTASITGISYLITVILLIVPFLFIKNVFIALAITLGIAAVIIALFISYYSVVKDVGFSKKFLEMLLLSFGIAAFSFGVGYVLKRLL